MDLATIQSAVVEGDYQYTLHALLRTTERHISRTEIEQIIQRAEVIEEYPHDKYGPSCLLYRRTNDGRPLHAMVSYPPMVKIITAYEPDPEEWENNRVRRSR